MTAADMAEVADLARLRAIAEEGRRQPLLGGRHMIVWGSAVIAATLFHWGVMTRVLPLPMIAVAVGWFGTTAVAFLVARFALPAKSPPRHDLGNRIERLVWTYGGGFLGVLAVAIFISFLSTPAGPLMQLRAFLFALMPAMSFGIYAVALRVTAEAADVPALKPYALIALGFAALTAVLAGSAWQFPATALGLLLVAILPGRMMIAMERAGG